MDSSHRPDPLDITVQPGAAADSAGPMSPCISICTLDESRVCRGCFRTVAEISGWLRLSPQERLLVLRNAEARRTAVPL